MSLLDKIGAGLTKFGASPVGKGTISFLRDQPITEIEKEMATNELLRQEGRIRKGTADAIETRNDPDRLARMQRLIEGVARGDERAKEILLAEAPEQLEQVLTTMGIDNQQKLEEVSRFSSEFLAAPPDQQDALLINRINEIDARGGDSSHTRSMLQMTPEERTAAARVAEVAALSAKDRVSRQSGASGFRMGAGLPIQREDGTFAFATPTMDVGTGGVETQVTPFPGTPVSRIGETAQGRQERDIATAGGKTTATGQATRQLELPQAKSRLASIEGKLDRMAEQAQEIMDDPGLPLAVGIGASTAIIPGSPGARVRADIKQLQSQAGLSVLQDMRDNSKTGGAVGQVSNFEQQLFQNNLAALGETNVSAEDYRSELQDIVDYANDAKGRFQKAFLDTYPKLAEQAEDDKDEIPDVSTMTDEELRKLAGG